MVVVAELEVVGSDLQVGARPQPMVVLPQDFVHGQLLDAVELRLHAWRTIEIIIHYIIYQDMQMKYDSILIRLEFLKISSIF